MKGTRRPFEVHTPLKTESPERLKERILREAARLGFCAAGVAAAGEVECRERYTSWIGRGRHASMGYLEKHMDVRLDSRRLLPGAASMIVVAMNYRHPRPEPGTPREYGRVSRYAWIVNTLGEANK